MKQKECAIGIVLSECKQRVLLVKRRDVPVWVLPGGGIDEGENAETAALREIKEETGLNVTATRKIAEYSPINRLASSTHTYECQITGGKLLLGDETAALDFFPISNLPQSLFFIHQQWLDDFLKGETKVIKKELSQVTYRAFFLYLMKKPYQTLRYLLTRFTSN